MADFTGGMISMGLVILALFFARFAWRTRDRLFALFALAFAMLAVDEVLFLRFAEGRPGRLALYAGRAAAYCLILAAIVDKNWPRHKPRRPEQR